MKENLTDVCTYFKNVIIKHTPDDFTVVEQFRYGLTDEEIIAGINAFRTFLYELYDRISAENPKIDIGEFAAMLYFMGVQGRLETEPRRELIVCGNDLLAKTKRKSQPHQVMKKMSAKRVAEIFEFLSEMGFYFEEIDCSMPIKLSETGMFYVTNENDSNLIVGIKLIAKAQENMPTEWDRLQNGFMRCDFYPLASEVPKNHDMNMVNFANTQPNDIKEWLLDLDKLLTDNDCYSEAEIWDYATITYTSRKTKKMVCRVDLKISGSTITPNTRNVKCLDEITPKLSAAFLSALKDDSCACGRGCKKGPYRISYKDEEYLSCNNPPHKPSGFNIPLSNADDRKVLRKWIVLEAAK